MKLKQFLFLCVLLISAPFAAKLTAQPLTLIYSGNLDGELEPCGCSEEGNLGGIKRRVQLLDQLRKESPDLVALSSGGLIRGEGVGDRLKSDYILEGFHAFGYDAIAVQWQDLVFGPELLLPLRQELRQAALPWVASNWKDTGGFDREKVIRRQINGRKLDLYFFSWLNPAESPTRKMHGEHQLVTDAVVSLREKLAAAKAAGGITVLSASVDLETVQGLLGLTNVDILLVKSAYEVYSEPKKVADTLVLQPGSRGMRIGWLQLELNGASIQTWQHKVIPMPNNMADATRMTAWYARYNEAVKQDYLRRVDLRKQQEKGESPYAGEEKCPACHVKPYAIWQKSEHSRAFEDLESVGKSFDPECLSCHTVGFDKPGGFFDFSMSSHLTNVQCENCHGAARAHVDSAGKKPVANKGWPREKVCGQCHVKSHSPAFAVEKYWPKIAH